MILGPGLKTYVKLLGVVTFVCDACQNPAAQRVVERFRTFTFFRVPLFSVKKQILAGCTFCGTAVPLSREQAARLLAPIEPVRAVRRSEDVVTDHRGDIGDRGNL